MSEFRLRFATDELERAQRAAEHARLAWKIARAAQPHVVALDEMEAYCEAADYAAEAQTSYERALAEGQAEWLATQRHREGMHVAGRTPLDVEASLVLGQSPVAHQVRRFEFISRED